MLRAVGQCTPAFAFVVGIQIGNRIENAIAAVLSQNGIHGIQIANWNFRNSENPAIYHWWIWRHYAPCAHEARIRLLSLFSWSGVLQTLYPPDAWKRTSRFNSAKGHPELQDVALNRNVIASGAKNELRENLVCGDVYRLLSLDTRKKCNKRNEGGICAT